MLVFRVSVKLKSGESLCLIFVKAQSRAEAIALARSHELIEEGDKATAVQVSGQHIAFVARVVIAIGAVKS